MRKEVGGPARQAHASKLAWKEKKSGVPNRSEGKAAGPSLTSSTGKKRIYHKIIEPGQARQNRGK